MSLLDFDHAANTTGMMAPPTIVSGTIYQLADSLNISEAVALRSPEESQKLTLYHTAQVEKARTEDMYFDGLMCE